MVKRDVAIEKTGQLTGLFRIYLLLSVGLVPSAAESAAATPESATAGIESRAIIAAGRLERAETVVLIDGTVAARPGHSLVIGAGRNHARAVGRIPAGTGDTIVGQSVSIGSGAEGPEVRIDRSTGSTAFADKQYAAAIIRIVEIRIIPAVPHEVAVPHEEGIAETQPERRAEAVTIAEPVVRRRISHAIIATISRCGSIIGVVRVIIVEIGPTIRVRSLHLNILVVRGRSIIIAGSSPG